MQYQISRVEKAMGLFIFIVLLIGLTFLVFNFKEGKLFKKRITLSTVTDKGYGFVKGSVVKVNGISAGTVEEITLEKDNSVKITMSIPEPFYENIHNDAIVQIIEPLAIGNSEINILPGSVGAPLVIDGDYLDVQAPQSLSARIEDKLETALNEFRKTAENMESITRKIDKGEGSLGKMINDPSLYDSAKEAVDSTRSIVESIKSTRIYVGFDSNYYYHQDVAISKFHLRVVPRESRYFWLGGAIFNPAGDSEITMDDDEKNYKIFPEFLVAQKIFDNRLTIRAGLLEGKFGGGIDFTPRLAQPSPQQNNSQGTERPKADIHSELLRLTIEARDTFDDADFNENIDNILLRAKARVRFLKYFNLEVGGDNLINDPAFFVGIGFEYLDEDISKIVGLIGAGK